MIGMKVLVFEILELSSASYFSKTMSSQKNFKFFNHFGILQINVSYPYSYWYCSPSSDSESNSESERQSRLYLEFNLSISASYCCLILVKLKVLGFLACGFGKGFCCCWFLLLSFGICKNNSWGPSHISLPSGWWLVLPS